MSYAARRIYDTAIINAKYYKKGNKMQTKTVTLEKVYKKLDNIEKLIKKIETSKTRKKQKINLFMNASESSTKFWNNKEDEIWNEL